ncbi:hypothetical protein R4Z10_07155 [Niallia sp. XMNu-256]|uniref:hypothetical protein n=1 Tax=Niallia sp. XMNu-256 TaxID=3082444 RepID=UPI0030CCAB41
MKGLATILMTFYLFVTVFWIANSPYLFSYGGIMIWMISIVLGFIVYKKMTGRNMIRNLMLYSNSFMLFLLIVTGLIHWTVTSMP